jgi:hypothetical protein
MSEGKAPVLQQRFVIQVPFKNRKSGKTTHTPILNFDGHLDYAHQMGLISLSSELVREWEISIPAGLDEQNQPKREITRYALVKATAVVRNQKSTGGITTSTGYGCAQDHDTFVKSPEYLVAVAETRAMKRALYNACGLTEAIISPEGKEATRESVDLPLHPGEEDEPSNEIPSDVRRNVTPAIPGLTHPSEKKGDAGSSGFDLEF